MTNAVERSFSSGEISPSLYARTDHQKYSAAVKTLRNMAVMRHGGAINRPGTQFIAEVRNSDHEVRLIPFIFNQQAGQTYILEFSNTKVRFYQDGGQVVEASVTITGATQANPCVITAVAHGYSNGDEVVISGIDGMVELNNRNFIVRNVTPNTFSLETKAGSNVNSSSYGAYAGGGISERVYTLISPYLQADIATLKYAQTGDVLTITHPTYPPYELQRLGAASFQFVLIDFTPAIGPPSSVSVTGNPGVNSYEYAVTCVAVGTQEESLAGTDGNNNLATISVSDPVIITWNSNIPETSYYKVYRIVNGVAGFVGTVIGTEVSPSFRDTGEVTPDFTNNPPSANNPFDSADNYPAAVGFVQQRRSFARSNNDPTTIWMSQAGLFTNFTIRIPTIADSDSIEFIPASEQVNEIQHLVELRQMLALTAGAEIWVQGDSAGIIRPTAVNPLAQSYFGAGSLRPIVIGDSCIFQQARGWFIRDFGFDFSVDGYKGNDLTIFAPHLFEGYELLDWAYQQIPHSIIWVVRSDGTVLGLTYVREQQILAWHRHDFMNGTVENVCCIPESPEDGVYFCIKRTIDGRDVRYIERMAPFYWSDVIDAPYMDSWLAFDGRNTGSITVKVDEGTNWTYTEPLRMISSSPYFTSSMVGDQIFINDEDGEQIRCTITVFTNSAEVTVFPNRTVPISLRDVPTTDWARAIQTVTNLWTLEGEDVSVFADRFVVASPNNQKYTTLTVEDGEITLDKPYSRIYVGLPVTADLETLDIDTAAGESIMYERKNISQVAAYVANSRGIWAGAKNPANVANPQNDLSGLSEYKTQGDRTTYDQPPSLRTDPIAIYINAVWDRNGGVFIRQVDPVPLQILSIRPSGLIPTKNPNVRV